MGKKFKVDGKEYDMDDFDDSRSWTKAKKDDKFYGHMKVSVKSHKALKSKHQRLY